MTYPITGPINSSSANNVDGINSYAIVKSGYRQARPYNLNLRYYADYKRTTYAQRRPYPPGSSPGYGNLANASVAAGGYAPYAYILDYGSPEVQSVFADARRKFSELAAPSAEALVDLIEAKQSAKMIIRRTTELLQLARAVKRLDVGAATRVLKRALSSSGKSGHKRALTKTRKAVVTAKSPAGMWLELHFGWAPLVGDLVSGMDLLQADFKPRKLKGRSKKEFPVHDGVQYPASESSNGHDNGFISVDAKRTVKCVVGADVRIDNPNLLLAQRLGFVNPLTTINELVPFSFVVDWFGNWSQWLGQYSEFYGLELTNAYHTVYFEKHCYYVASGKVFGFGSPPPHWDFLGENFTAIGTDHIYVDRRIGIPAVTLGFRLPERISLVRAATAASLLVQQLRSFH